MKESNKEIKTMLKEQERRISRLEKLIMTSPGKGYKRPTGRKKGKGKRKKARSTSGRPGPGAMIDQLIAKGFFKKRRVMKDIIEYCKNNLAYTYKTKDVAVALGRAVRSEKLKRQKNQNGRFEYFQQ